MVLMALTAMAIPAKRGVKTTLTLQDGTQVVAELRGDEFGHFYETEDGRAFLESETPGIYVAVDKMQIERNAESRRMARNSRRSTRHKEFGVPTSYTGSKKGIVILVNFANKSFLAENDQARFEKIANTENYSEGNFKGSVHDYFTAQSNGNFDLTFDVVGPVTVEHNYEYYGGNDYYGNDKHPEDMVIEACNLVKDMVNFADYDWDGDGEVDQVYVIYAYKGEADSGIKSTIWPHEWQLSAVNKTLTIDGVRINTYACGPELNGSGSINGIGTMCHEFSHCLGLPDFYDTRGGGNFGLNAWSLMDYGCYNDNGFTPCNYTGYERMFCGWITPTDLKGNRTVTGMKSLSDFGEVFIMRNPGNADEYYILQNVQKKGWDAHAEGSGLLIMHVDYDKKVWQENTVNNVSSHQRCTIFPADNLLSYYNLSGDPFPYSAKNSFGNTTTPAARLFNNNTDGKKLMNIEITDIKKNSDGTVSFNFVNNNEGNNDPEEPIGNLIFSETFDKCNGTGGNDGRWGGSIASSIFNPDAEGWEAQSAFGADKCARFGTSKIAGQATTPAFTVNGTATLTFLAAPWEDETGELTVNSVNENVTVSGTTFALEKGKWNECSITLTGNGDTKLSFAGNGTRFFLDQIAVAQEGTNGISIINSRKDGESTRIYSIDGRYLGTDINILGKGLYIVGGKKIAK